MSDENSKLTELQKDISELKSVSNDVQNKFVKLQYDYNRLDDGITPLRHELKAIIESINGVAGNVDKIGLVGQLRDISNDLHHLNKEVNALKNFEKEQNKFNLLTATKNAVIPIIFAILLHILVFLFGGGK